jgi:predicted phage terminase large subunit-like protein
MFLRRNFDVPTEVPECHREWWTMCCSNHKFVAIAAPRNHAKSTAITHSYTLACILLRERQFILVVSDTEAQAAFFVADLKKELEDNEDLMKVFGVKKITKDTVTDFIVEFDDGYQARVIAKGSEQKVRGLKWDKKRPDLIICDDMENDEIVMNPDRRLKFRNWFQAALLPCRSVNGIVRYVGTILHMDSALERIMPREHDKTNEETDLYTKGSIRNSWYSIKYKAHTSDFGSILWPSRWPAEALRAERQRFVDQGQGDKYSQEFLNIPIDEANAFFKRGDFIPMRQEDSQTKKIYYIGCDLATKTMAGNTDFTAFVIGGVDEEGVLNIVDVIKERMDSVEIVETIMQLNKIYEPMYFFFEKGALTNSVLPHMIVESIDQDNFVSYELFNRSVDKRQFAHAIQARMRTKRVRFNKTMEWFQDFESEMLRFPRDTKDDQVDAIAILGHGVVKFQEAPTKQEEAEEMRMEEMNDADLLDEGRSMVTGY